MTQQQKQTTPDLKHLVAGKVRFLYYRKGNLYYRTESGFVFSVPIEDCGDATFNAEDKGLLFMRYIRKAIQALAEDSKEETKSSEEANG